MNEINFILVSLNMDNLRSSIRKLRKGRAGAGNNNNGSVRQCESDHCDCCEIKTFEETYTVTVENNQPGSKVSVGDKVVVYKTDAINISPKENTVVQLERVSLLLIISFI